MKVKGPKATPVQEDPAVKAQRLAAEKAATEANNAAVGDVLERKTRLKARVYGAAPGAATSGASFASPTPSAGRPVIPQNFNVGGIWKGGMY